MHSFTEINATTPGTIEAWVYIDALSGNNMIFDTGDAGGSGITLLSSGGQLVFGAGQGASTDFKTIPAPAAGEWHHLAVVTRMNASNQVELYVNGSIEATVRVPLTNWASGAFGLGTTNGTTIGGYSGDLAGQIAHFRVHDEALTSAIISYHAANPGLSSAEPYVAGYNTTGTLGTVNGFADGSFQYSPNNQFESLGAGQSTTDSFTYTYDDGLGNLEIVNVTLTINGINDAPTLASIEGVPAAYNENNPSLIVTGNLSIADIDDINIESATIAITGNFSAAEDVLNFTDQNGISGNYDAGTGILSLTGSSTQTNYQSAIRSVSYQNTSDNPSELTRTVSFTINDGSVNSNTLSRDITVNAQNDAPTITNLETAATTYSENALPVAITDTLTLSDQDNTTIQSAAVSITGNFVPGGEDMLNFTNQSGISGSYNVTSGVLSLSGTASLADYQAAIRSISYDNTSDDPSGLSRTVSIVVDDGTSSSTTATRTIDVNPQNDSPALSALETSPAGYTENAPAAAITNTLLVSDPDSTQMVSATVSISGNFAAGEDTLNFTDQSGISGSYNPGTGVLNLSGSATATDYQTALRSITYHNSSENPSSLSRTLSFVVNDGSSNSNTATRDIAVTAVNDSPAVTLSGLISYIENATATLLAPTATVADPDSADFDGGTLSVSLTSGADALDHLRILSSGSGPGQVGAGVSTVHYQGVLVGNHSGGHGTDPLVIHFNPAATAAAVEAVLQHVGFEHLSDNPQLTRGWQITLTDGDTGTTTTNENIVITRVNDAVALNSVGGESVFAFNDAGVYRLDQGLDATITDPDTAADFAGGSLSLNGINFSTGDELGVLTSAALTLSAGLTAGSTISVSGIAIGTLDTVAAGSIEMSFNANATPERVDTLLQSFSFTTNSAVLGTRAVDYAFNDADGTANGGSEVTSATINLLVGDSAGGFVTTTEDTTYAFSINDFSFTGISTASIDSITITALPGAGVLELSGTPVSAGDNISRALIDSGLLRYTPPADQNGLPYTLFSFYINNGNSQFTILPGEPNSFTFGGGSWAAADAIVADNLHFGPSGTITTTVSVAAQSSLTDTSYLSAGNLLINGFVADGSVSAAEFAAIDQWVRGGGILVSGSDSSAFDELNEFYGLTTLPAVDSVWQLSNDSHPLINGP
ncbi:MAG: LamG-like jellyroll fold domain-containing protein, partial [Pseudomonadota bacterium]